MPVAEGKTFPNLKELSSMLITFGLIVFAWIFFRANNIEHAISYISGILSPSLFSIPEFEGRGHSIVVILLLVIFVLIEWNGREGQYAIANLGHKRIRAIRWSYYALIIFAIGMFMPSVESPFIYFQF